MKSILKNLSATTLIAASFISSNAFAEANCLEGALIINKIASIIIASKGNPTVCENNLELLMGLVKVAENNSCQDSVTVNQELIDKANNLCTY